MIYWARSRPERLIASARVVLAVSSLLAVWLDPSEPARHAAAVHAILAGYVIYAGGLMALAWTWRTPWPVLGLATHGVDLALFTVLMYFTEGASSPFFAYIVFSQMCATLRWQVRGTVWTAIAALVGFVGLGILGATVLHDPAFALNRFLMRIVYLIVLAVFLGYLSHHEHKVRSEMSLLASWPRTAEGNVRRVVGESLEHAARVVEVPRVVAVWEEPEEPWLNVVAWSRQGIEWTEMEEPTTIDSLVHSTLSGMAFLCADSTAQDPRVLCSRSSPPDFEPWQGSPIAPEFRKRFGIGSALSVVLTAENFRGRVFFLDKNGLTPDDLVLAMIAAHEIAGRLDHSYFEERLRESAAAEERVRLARDLHDGVLQFLTGTALQVRTAAQVLGRGHDRVAVHLEDIERMVAQEQRRLRSFIARLNPRGGRRIVDHEAGLRASLTDLVDRLQGQWRSRVELKVGDDVDLAVSAALVDNLYHIVHEAAANAARHGNASTVRVEVFREGDTAHVIVSDDGRGFSFRGDFDHAGLVAAGVGPRSLMDRAAALGGSLSIHSSDLGARLDIALPLTRRES